MPFPTLTAETLQYLNLPNSIHDHIHFAQTVSLPFDAHNETHPSKSPWVLIGGSYSGALAAWTQHIMPGTFYAYHASSAVVQAIYEFDEYFAPIEAALPRNCSRDVQAVVARVDRVLTRDDPGEVAHLKNLFGLADIEHHDDFAELITIPLWKWQNEPEEVHAFCDHIQLYADDDEDDDDDVEEEPQGSHVGGRKGKKGRRDTDDEKGVGVEIALKAYADWVDRTVGPICESYICDTYRNPEAFNQPTNVDGDRQWYWFLCNGEFPTLKLTCSYARKTFPRSPDPGCPGALDPFRHFVNHNCTVPKTNAPPMYLPTRAPRLLASRASVPLRLGRPGLVHRKLLPHHAPLAAPLRPLVPGDQRLHLGLVDGLHGGA